MVSHGLFAQLLVQLLLQELQLHPCLRKLCLELCYFLGMSALLKPGTENKADAMIAFFHSNTPTAQMVSA